MPEHSITADIFLKKGKEAPVSRFHPWIFSGAIHHIEGEVKDGDLVRVLNFKKEVAAIGHYNNGSIAVRVLAFQEQEIDEAFWQEKFKKAYAKRKAIPHIINEETNCYRLVHAEGDQVPGLIVDVYGKVAVMQCHSIGMHKQRKIIANAIISQVNGCTHVFDKSKQVLPKPYSFNFENGYLIGDELDEEYSVSEYGHQFLVNWKTGQKTGFFLDQRENRKLLAHYSKNKSVLNTFCYSGGFSIYALAAGATEVHSVDISQKAMDLTDKNADLNPSFKGEHHSHTADVMKFLKEHPLKHDIVVVDPPAFAKNFRKRHNAVQGYKRLNALALEKVKPGGLMFTFSCSQVIDTLLFQNTIVAAGLESGREISILHRLSQPSDHPVNLYHPEGSYLKGLVVYVG